MHVLLVVVSEYMAVPVGCIVLICPYNSQLPVENSVSLMVFSKEAWRRVYYIEPQQPAA